MLKKDEADKLRAAVRIAFEVCRVTAISGHQVQARIINRDDVERLDKAIEREEIKPVFSIDPRIVKMIWGKLTKAKNPYFEGAISDPSEHRAKWESRNVAQINLCREFFHMVFDNAQVTEDALKRAMDFLYA